MKRRFRVQARNGPIMISFEVQSTHPCFFVHASAPQLGGVDDTALAAQASNPSGDSSATARSILVNDPLEALRASLTNEEGDAVLGDAYEKTSLSSLQPVGRVEHELASTETSVTDDDQTASNIVTAAPDRSVFEEEGFVSNEQQSGVNELSATGTDIQEQNTRCLLYTSPSPRDRQKSRMPSSA